MYIYLVCVDLGAYMEPDIEILKIFKYKKDAFKYINYVKSEYSIFHPPFISKRKVELQWKMK